MAARRDFSGSSYVITVCVRPSFGCWDQKKMFFGKSVGESTRWGWEEHGSVPTTVEETSTL